VCDILSPLFFEYSNSSISLSYMAPTRRQQYRPPAMIRDIQHSKSFNIFIHLP
jgi:hypothetical protein